MLVIAVNDGVLPLGTVVFALLILTDALLWSRELIPQQRLPVTRLVHEAGEAVTGFRSEAVVDQRMSLIQEDVMTHSLAPMKVQARRTTSPSLILTVWL